MLRGVMGRHVELDELRAAAAEQGAAAAGEILQPGADRQNEIGLARQRVGRRAAGDADRADRMRMIPGERSLAGLRLGHGDAGGA